jgi:hypothetical protein
MDFGWFKGIKIKIKLELLVGLKTTPAHETFSLVKRDLNLIGFFMN